MPVGLLLLVALVGLALYLDRNVCEQDKVRYINPPTNNLTQHTLTP